MEAVVSFMSMVGVFCKTLNDFILFKSGFFITALLLLRKYFLSEYPRLRTFKSGLKFISMLDSTGCKNIWFYVLLLFQTEYL